MLCDKMSSEWDTWTRHSRLNFEALKYCVGETPPELDSFAKSFNSPISGISGVFNLIFPGCNTEDSTISSGLKELS